MESVQSAEVQNKILIKRVSIRPLLISLRPYQWIKNFLVFGGLIFSISLFNWTIALRSIVAFIAFCFASSSVYLLNDLRDVEEDKLHPSKRLRPLAAGTLNTGIAITFMFLLFFSSAILSWLLDPKFAGIVLTYFIMNIAYSLGLKKMVIVDVMIVSAGFLLRALAGCVVIGVKLSPWLFLCTMLLALLMGFGKRRHEINFLQNEAHNHRKNLTEYSVPLLDTMMTICGATAIATYALYTMADETIAHFGSNWLVLTTPFVLYGIFRYFYLVHQKDGGGDPTKLLVADMPSLINICIWVICVCVIIYGKL
ncbi:MAG: decaprenyl-phosphate phosphoribosyltransferase [Bacteroidota bacterium]|nr:decaprenyl-phosphate phosphoribosyltransferase [Bacteroidota bacterium]MDP4273314.1 decaprenyl-phosphate phosphoribosyltransferase [Bacteroidota bacterium]